MSFNNFYVGGISVAAALAESTSIRSVDFSENNLGMFAPQVAEAFTKSPSIHAVNMAKNCHDVFGMVSNPQAINEVMTVFTDHHNYIVGSKELINSTLSDSLHNPLIELIGGYASQDIEFNI